MFDETYLHIAINVWGRSKGGAHSSKQSIGSDWTGADNCCVPWGNMFGNKLTCHFPVPLAQPSILTVKCVCTKYTSAVCLTPWLSLLPFSLPLFNPLQVHVFSICDFMVVNLATGLDSTTGKVFPAGNSCKETSVVFHPWSCPPRFLPSARSTQILLQEDV